MANWQDAEYGPAATLDLGIVKIVVNEIVGAQGEPTVYYYSFGPYRKSGFATRQEAQAAALRTVRVRLGNALAMLDSFEAKEESEKAR